MYPLREPADGLFHGAARGGVGDVDVSDPARAGDAPLLGVGESVDAAPAGSPPKHPVRVGVRFQDRLDASSDGPVHDPVLHGGNGHAEVFVCAGPGDLANRARSPGAVPQPRGQVSEPVVAADPVVVPGHAVGAGAGRGAHAPAGRLGEVAGVDEQWHQRVRLDRPLRRGWGSGHGRSPPSTGSQQRRATPAARMLRAAGPWCSTRSSAASPGRKGSLPCG